MQFWVKSTFIPVDISCQSHIVYKSYIMTGRDCIKCHFQYDVLYKCSVQPEDH